MAANATSQTISFAASTGERATLKDVLFGDVYVCGGQSNMHGARSRQKITAEDTIGTACRMKRAFQASMCVM
jgi:hypothetical protein